MTHVKEISWHKLVKDPRPGAFLLRAARTSGLTSYTIPHTQLDGEFTPIHHRIVHPLQGNANSYYTGPWGGGGGGVLIADKTSGLTSYTTLQNVQRQ